MAARERILAEIRKRQGRGGPLSPAERERIDTYLRRHPRGPLRESPADPIALAIWPTDEMRAMPGGVVTGPVTGFFAGTVQGLYRFITGALDVAFCPLGIFSTFSPEPRYKALTGWEYEG